jgi:arabinan endo-1,5-alpha-L-arabinosidase
VTTFTNPVFDHVAPDPAVIRDPDGVFWCYTTMTYHRRRRVWVPVLRSEDLVHWAFIADALPRLPAWGRRAAWAPHVEVVGGRYVLYLTVETRATGSMQLGLATADRPEGPFEPEAEPLIDDAHERIDANVLTCRNGERFLVWSEENRVRVAAIGADRIRPAGEARTVLLPIGEEGTGYDSVVEGPWAIERDGAIYLFTSGDVCCTYADPHYAVAASRASSPLKPFERFPGNPILESTDGPWIAPGHCAVVRDDAGADWMLYHAMRSRRLGPRVMMLDRIEWRDGWPHVGRPSSDPREAPVVTR